MDHKSRKDALRAGTKKIPRYIRDQVESHFTSDLLDRVGYRVGGGNEFSLARNSFRFGGKSAITLDYVIVFLNEDDTQYCIPSAPSGETT